ncbi:MAG: alanine--tRNA ligase [candidate division Zixibacteria bacterium]|nr:alanine--tRNA ligase [candidate division Zixibacteria bacterium]
MIPQDDPTLLFVNAGMNQFKDVFTGSRKVSYARATSSQKCIRAGGKHNDLENVGKTSRHQTFFEMLGNFSFGDYFKEQAIYYAWEYVTKTLGLSKDRLYATVYTTDDEAFALWEKIAPELKNGKILRFGKEDNYWSMGDVGPCGPCSEIHYDMGDHLSKDNPKAWINNENDRYIEFWNLVFMQYDQPAGGGEIVPLPKPSVDTGAGLERICAIMQGVDSNFETDLFTPLTAHVADITGVKYDKGKNGVSHRVIADHVRALSFALADGGGLSSEKRGSVLRKILNRAAWHGRLLGYKEPIICKLVPTVIEVMGGHFTELKDQRIIMEYVLRLEEERFGDLLDTGIEYFSNLEKKIKATGSDTVSGKDIFYMSATLGFPIDLVPLMAKKANLKLDYDGYNRLMNVHREQSRAGSAFDKQSGDQMKAFLDSFIVAGIKQPKTLISDPPPDLQFDTAFVSGSQAGTSNDVSVVLKEVFSYENYPNATIWIHSDNFKMKVDDVIIHDGIYIHTGTLLDGTMDENIIGKSASITIDNSNTNDLSPSSITEIDATEFVRGDHGPAFHAEAAIRYIREEDDCVEIILDKTPFYVESGGQVRDAGMIVAPNASILVTHVYRNQDLIFHIGKIQNGTIDDFKIGTKVTARIDKHRRKDIMRNHTATHLLHAALRRVLGDHVKQSGSLVEADKLRFDFAHFQAMTPEQVATIEKIVNENIINATPVMTEEKPIEEAMNSGAMALFGEKYGDTVRVVSVRDLEHSDAEPISMELCGGTHVNNTAEIGLFMITEESAIASGVRRIEAVTGRKATEMMQLHKNIARNVGAQLNAPAEEVLESLQKLTGNYSELQKEIKKLKAERFSGGGSSSVGHKETIGQVEFTYNDFGETDQESMAGWSDSIKGMNNPVVSLAVGVLKGKKTFIASASKPAVELGFDTSKHFGAMVKELGGRGGGKAAFARGGLPDDINFDLLIEKAKETLKEVLS